MLISSDFMKGSGRMKVYNVENNNIVGTNIRMADKFFARLKGLMFQKELPEGEGLIISPCNSIHMFFMNFPIDVVFLNKDDEVVALVEGIKPRQISKIYFNAAYVIELPVSTIKNADIKVGNRLKCV